MKLYLQLNEPGSGEISVPCDSTAAADVASGKYIELHYRGDARGGFFVENIEKTDVDGQENAGRWLAISGRGSLALLDEAIVWDYLTPGIENTRKFVAKSKGEILWTLLDEAKNIRGCFPILDVDFTTTEDSLGNAWTDSEDIEIRVGTTLLDVLRQFADLGIDFQMERGVHGTFTLRAYRDGLGSDVSDTIHLRVGHNCTEVTNTEEGGEIRNAVLVEFSHPTIPYSVVEDVASQAAYRRREHLLQAANANESSTADAYGQAELNALKDPKRAITLKVTDAIGSRVFVDYGLGDWISYDDGTGTEVAYRVRGIALEWIDQWYADVTLELNSVFMETEIRSARDLRKFGGASSGSSVMTHPDPQQVGISLIDTHNTDVTAHGGSPLSTALNDFLVGNGSVWEKKTLLQTQTILGCVPGSWQPVDATLTSISALGSAADKTLYTTGVDTWAETGLTAFGRSLLDDADAAAGRTTLGLIAGGAGDIWVEKAGDTMTGQLFIDLGADVIGLRVQGSAAQTANLQTWENSGGTVLGGFSYDGRMGIGFVPQDRTGLRLGLSNATPTDTFIYYGMRYSASIIIGANQTNYNYSAYGEGTCSVGAGFTMGGRNEGGRFYCIKQGDGTLVDGSGLRAYITLTAGTITNAAVIYAGMTNAGVGAITTLSIMQSGSVDGTGVGTLYGLNIGASTLATNIYGIFIGNIVGATNTYSIVASQGTAIFNENGTSTSDFRIEGDTRSYLFFVDASADNIGINCTAPDVMLHLAHVTGEAILRFERDDGGINLDDIYGKIQFEGQDASASSNGVRGEIVGRATGTTGGMSLDYYSTWQGTTALHRVFSLYYNTLTLGEQVTAAFDFVINPETTSLAKLYGYSDTATASANINFYKARGTKTAPTTCADGTELFQISGYGWDGATYKASSYIISSVEGVVAADSVPSNFLFYITPAGGTVADVIVKFTTTGVIINETGTSYWDLRVEGDTNTYLLFVDASTDNIGINTDAPTSKLHVVGDIYEILAMTADVVGYGGRFYATNTGGTADIYGALGRARVSNVTGASGSPWGARFYSSVTNSTANDMTTSGSTGFFGQNEAVISSTGDITIAGSYCIRAEAPAYTVAGGGVLLVTAQYGLYAFNQGNTYTTTSYGIFVATQSGSTGTNYALVTNGGTVVFNTGGAAEADFTIKTDTYDAVFIDTSNNSIVIMSNAAGKVGFFGAAAVVQATELTDELTTITCSAPGAPDYAIQDLVAGGYGFVTVDEGQSALKVIANLQARVNELENKLTTYGLLVDAD